ncbi:hypothetical protein [Afipia birgiae]|uniref:hypothetical protein n=1 Tax=Afipia birgiae TaxID=151414 RepID=UPI001FCA59AB|nr:hypothetical protein [Afipia birgiae]
MEVYCKGTARIRHGATGEIYEIESDELDWDAVGGDERQMGPEIHYEAVVEHPQLGELTWGLWEYPVGIENYQETKAGPHEVIEDFDYGLEHSAPEPDDWIDYTVPDNPFTIFMSSYHHTGDLLADHGRDSGGHLLNRMVFSHQVTALEAYLSDTLMNEVMADKAAMQRMIDEDDDLAKEKFTLAEISKDPGLVASIFCLTVVPLKGYDEPEILPSQSAQFCLIGADAGQIMYLAILDCATANPSLSSSPWIRGAPQSGFSTLIRRISARSSVSICGRPPNDRDFHRQ